MKKNVLYLMMMVCLFGFFTACSSDDDEPKVEETTWKDALGTYTAVSSSRLLTIEGATPSSSQELTLTAGSGENAKITLTNMVPEEAALEIDNVIMTKSGADYSFTGETKVGTSTISVAGTMKGLPATKESDAFAATIDIKVTRRIDAAIAGIWGLNILTGDTPTAAFMIDTEIENPMLPMMQTMVGGMIAQKASEVNLVLNENGTFDVNWKTVGATQSVNLVDAIVAAMAGNPNVPSFVPDLVRQILKIDYFTIDNTFYLALNKQTIDLAISALAALPESPLPAGIDVAQIIGTLMEARGNYYVMPIGMDDLNKDIINISPNSKFFFYLEKEKVLAVLEIMAPLLPALINDPAMAGMIEGMLAQLTPQIATAQKFNLGLVFTK